MEHFDQGHLMRQHIQWFEWMKIPAIIQGGVLWYAEDKMAQPFMPFSKPLLIEEREIVDIVDKLGAGYARWTQRCTKNDVEKHSWYILAAQYYAFLEDLSSHTRKLLDKACQFYEIKEIRPSFLAHHGHFFHSSQVKDILTSGDGMRFKSELESQRFLEIENLLPKMVQYYGVFHESKLVGFARCLMMSETEVHIAQIRILAAYIKPPVITGMIWYILDHYLNSGISTQVVIGARPYDPTFRDLDAWTVNLPFQKVPLKLGVYFKNKMARQISLMKPDTKIMRSFGPSLYQKTFRLT